MHALPPGNGDPGYATDSFGEALVRLLAASQMSAHDLVDRLGRSWRYRLSRLPKVDRGRLPPDHFRQIREVFGLPAGYFAEEREATVFDEIRHDPDLRDELYFALLERSARGVAAAVAAPAGQLDSGAAEDFVEVPVAPPTFYELVIVVVDISTLAEREPSAFGEARAAIAGLLNDVAAADRSGSFTVSFVTVTESGVASTEPVNAQEVLGDAFLDALWRSGATGQPQEGEEVGQPLLADGLEVARRTAAEFLAFPYDVPTSVVTFVLSSGASDDPARAEDVAGQIRELGQTAVVAYDLVGIDPDGVEADTLRAIASDPASAPVPIAGASLADWLHLRGSFINAGRR